MRFLSILEIVARRSLGNWKLLLAVAFGVVLAVALISSTAIYTDALDDLGLDYTLDQHDPRELDPRIESSTFRLESSQFEPFEQRLQSRVDSTIGPFVRDDSLYLKSATFYPTDIGAEIAEENSRPRAFLQNQEGLEEHITIVEGRMPQLLPAGEGPPQIEAAIGAGAAESFGISVGDSFDLHPFWRPDAVPIPVTIVGLIEPIDLEEEYWLGYTDRFDFPSPSWDTYALWTTRETMIEQVPAHLPDINGDLLWGFYIDYGGLNARNAEQVKNGVRSLAAGLNQGEQRTTVNTDLADVIAEYDTKLFFTRIPLFVLIIQIVAIVLYYLVLVSSMLVDRQAGEIALLKSRGASTRQVMSVYAIEGLALALIGIALGPLIAGAVVSLLGKTPAFEELSGGELLEINYSWTAYGMAAGGALLAVLALLIPAYRASNYSIVRYKQNVSRKRGQSPFLKYYLDLFFVLIGAILFFELQERGSLHTETLFGERKTDPILLMTPAVFMITVSILFLRLFPLMLRLLSWALARISGASVLLGLRHLTRTPGAYAGLIILLMLATSLGMFAASFSETLERSFVDRAGYSTGSDLRITTIDQTQGAPQLQAEAESWDGVQSASAALRTTASYEYEVRTEHGFTLLGVQPETFAGLAYFREDFADESLSSLMDDIISQPLPGGPPVPDEARFIGMWVYVTEPLTGGAVFVRLRDETGSYADFGLGFVEPVAPDEEFPEGWRFMIGDLSQVGFRRNQQPLDGAAEVVSIAYRRFRGAQSDSGEVWFDNLQWSTSAAEGPAGFEQSNLIDGFEEIGPWRVGTGFNEIEAGDQVARATDPVHDGAGSLRLAWSKETETIPQRTATVMEDGEPLKVLVSDKMMSATGLSIGEEFRLRVGLVYVDSVVVDRFLYFPTYAENTDESFLVTDLERLLGFLNRNPGNSQESQANEIWMDIDEGADAAVLAQAEEAGLSGEVFSFAELQNTQQTDPLVSAGWEGILFIAFVAILILSAVGYLVYSFLTAQTRSLEFAILRTMGLSTRQIAITVVFEQAFVIGLGVLLGTLLGSRLGRLMMDYMGVTETGEDVLPPFQFATSWAQIATAYGILAAVFFGVILAVVILYSRLAVYRVLRIGEL
jgi:ABC-type lipoprotein release transport system permease subunit